ncbi:RagB/SusD family nutrient uptake outer membrane protein [Chitinophaga sp. 22620]|uniref:RagB/SusD family nutrient uptake outer membrane protein n=1 Tax=Chitinophaga sp. 22620 TaxID=3453952 RepID=UPI003F875FEA
MNITHLKRLAILTGIFFLAVSFNSCKKFLTLSPNSAFDEAYVFGSVNDAYSAVLGTYATLAGDRGYGGRIQYYFSNDCDESYCNASNTVGIGGDNGPKALCRYNAVATNTELDAEWNIYYAGIDRANQCIKNIPQMHLYNNGSDNDKASLRRLHGEALALRAQFFFDIIKFWGDVPAPYIPSIDQPDLNLPATNRDSIYDHILNDLAMAATLLPWRGDPGVAVDERITKGGAKALRARIALFRGGYSLRAASKQMERPADYLKYYQIARDECNDIINSGKHKLNPSFLAVFKDNFDAHKIEPNGEVLFQVGLSGGNGVSDGRVGFIDGIRTNGNGMGSDWALPTYFYKFDSMDARRDVTIASYAINGSGHYIGSASVYGPFLMGKFRRDWHSNPATPFNSNFAYTGISWPMIRYPDVLLMLAEAENEINQGPTAAATDAFRQVRVRGFNGDESKIGTIPSDYAGFFKAIADERMFEFGGEGLRKWDLIRWNLISTVFAETRSNLDKFRQRQAPYENVPATMYYLNNSTTGIAYYSSYYQPSPSTAPAGYTSVKWASAYLNTFANDWAGSFVPNQREILPYGPQTLSSNPSLRQGYDY